jgi:hypothetical protein
VAVPAPGLGLTSEPIRAVMVTARLSVSRINGEAWPQ